jgi:hypothetical protein
MTALEAYLQQQQANQQTTLGNLQQAQALQGMQANAQKQQREQAYRQAIAGAQTPEDQLKVAVQFGGPDAAMKALEMGQASKDRIAASKDALQANLAQKKELADAHLTQSTKYAEMMHEFRMAQAKTDAEKLVETNRHNKQLEALQAQNAATNEELKRLGLQMQSDKTATAQKEKEDKDIEGQINKTANRLKDVQPVMVAAHQLNNLLNQYTPDTVPGVGYAKNTDLGKMVLTKEGKDVSSSIKLVGNAILKAMSGTAVTAPEEVRQMAAQMADGRYGAQDFYIAWPKVADWLNSQSAVAASGLTDPARQRLIERTGINLDPVKPRYKVDYQQGKLNLLDTHKAPEPPAGFTVNP